MSKWTAERRRNLPLSDFGDPSARKFPISDQDDVDSAAHLIGKADNPEAVRKRVIAIAHRLNLSIPDAWKEDGKAAANPAVEHKSFAAASVKAIDKKLGILEAVVSVFNNVDQGGDVILPGFFAKSLRRKLPKGVWQHNWDLPIAKTLEARELLPGDPELPESIRSLGGLYIKGQFNLDTQRGREAFSDIDFGTIDEFSIGYSAVKQNVDKKTGVRELIEGNVYEWSPVLVGMNTATALLSTKAADDDVKAMAESDDASGGATVPADDHPMQVRKGDKVKWGAYAKGIVPGHGKVVSIHTKGVVPDTSNEAEATDDEPHARVQVHARDADGDLLPVDDHQAHPVKCLFKCGDTMSGLAALKPETKGEYLGDTDEMMACAAYSRLHDTLGYYVVSQVHTDQSPDEVKANVGAAIDEFKDTTLSLLSGVLLEDDPEDDDDESTAEDAATAPPAYGSMCLASLASKFLHSLSGHDTSRERVVSALALEDRSKSVVSAATGLAEIGRHFADVRLKEGRMLSASTVGRITAAIGPVRDALAALEALVNDAAPKTPPGEGKALDADSPPPPHPTQGDAAMSGEGEAAIKADPADILRARAELARYEFESSGA